MIIGYRYLGKRSLIYTIYGTLALSFWIWLWQLLPVSLNVHHDLFIAAILAGIHRRFGLGLFNRFNGRLAEQISLPGSLKRKKAHQWGQSLFALDVCVLVASLTYIDLRRMMYTLVCSFVFSRVVNFIQDGGYSARGIIIMTQHPDEISNEIMKTMDRGVTYLQTQGAYSKKEGKAPLLRC